MIGMVEGEELLILVEEVMSLSYQQHAQSVFV
jgi:hypothetical protein